jgi:hypothetical protein
MTPIALFACALLLILLFAYVFWPQQFLAVDREHTRRDALLERKAAIYENLRDLNFENRAAKYPEADYKAQRHALESEAAEVLREIDSLPR